MYFLPDHLKVDSFLPIVEDDQATVVASITCLQAYAFFFKSIGELMYSEYSFAKSSNQMHFLPFFFNIGHLLFSMSFQSISCMFTTLLFIRYCLRMGFLGSSFLNGKPTISKYLFRVIFISSQGNQNVKVFGIHLSTMV